MGWTEERVELLKKLWADGLSASQIAGRLGEVTRNAVIGKVHRLGLAGRATTSRLRSPRPRNRVAHLPIRPTRVQYRTHGNVALKPMFMPVEQPAVALALVPSIVEELEHSGRAAHRPPRPEGMHVPLADRRSSGREFPFLRPAEDRRRLLLRASCPRGLPAGGAPQEIAFSTDKAGGEGRILMEGMRIRLSNFRRQDLGAIVINFSTVRRADAASASGNGTRPYPASSPVLPIILSLTKKAAYSLSPGVAPTCAFFM